MQLHKNQQLELTIDSFGAQGEGIARVDGMPVFIPQVLPGERARVQIVKVDKRFAFGRAMEVLQASPQRREPLCPYYVQCGGCVCQHMSYEAQLDFKRNQVEGCLRHIGGIEAEVAPVLGMDAPWHYRNKISMPVSGTAGAPAIGYYAQRSHRVVDVHSCLLSCDAADRAGAAVRQWMVEQRIPPYNEESHTGLVRHIMTRVNRQGQLICAGCAPDPAEVALQQMDCVSRVSPLQQLPYRLEVAGAAPNEAHVVELPILNVKGDLPRADALWRVSVTCHL